MAVSQAEKSVKAANSLRPSGAKALSTGDGSFLGTLGSPRGLCVMFFSAAVMETWMEIKTHNIPPRPARYVGISLVYGILAVVGHFWPHFTGILGLGLTMALAAKIGQQATAQSATAGPGLTPVGPAGAA